MSHLDVRRVHQRGSRRFDAGRSCGERIIGDAERLGGGCGGVVARRFESARVRELGLRAVDRVPGRLHLGDLSFVLLHQVRERSELFPAAVERRDPCELGLAGRARLLCST